MLCSGVIGSIVFSAKLTSVPSQAALYTASNYYTGFSLFWGGLTMGCCNLLCGIAVGISGSNAAIGDAADPCMFPIAPLLDRCEWVCCADTILLLCFSTALFVKILVIEVFSSILGLFGLIVGLLVVSGSSAPEAVSSLKQSHSPLAPLLQSGKATAFA